MGDARQIVFSAEPPTEDGLYWFISFSVEKPDICEIRDGWANFVGYEGGTRVSECVKIDGMRFGPKVALLEEHDRTRVERDDLKRDRDNLSASLRKFWRLMCEALDVPTTIESQEAIAEKAREMRRALLSELEGDG